MKVGDVQSLVKSALHATEFGAPRALSVIMMIFEQRGRVYYDGAWHDPKLLVYKVQGKMASHTPVMFFGGNDIGGRKRRYYYGSIFDWLVDCCFYALAHNDPKQQQETVEEYGIR